jgi:hypothetical protein
MLAVRHSGMRASHPESGLLTTADRPLAFRSLDLSRDGETDPSKGCSRAASFRVCIVEDRNEKGVLGEKSTSTLGTGNRAAVHEHTIGAAWPTLMILSPSSETHGFVPN